MKLNTILAFTFIALMAACNNTSSGSTTIQDSVVTPMENNTMVSPGVSDSAKNGIHDSVMGNLDSRNLNKR